MREEGHSRAPSKRAKASTLGQKMFSRGGVSSLRCRGAYIALHSPPLLGNRFYSASNVASLGLMDGMKRWFERMGKKSTIVCAKGLFASCQLQAGLPIWHSRGMISNDFRGKHMVLVLHVWMIHKRLMTEGKAGLLVQEALFDELWEDTCSRIRAHGIGEMSVNKNLKDVQGYSFRCCVEMDHALALPKTVTSGTAEGSSPAAPSTEVTFQHHEDRVLDELAGALWRGVYAKNESVPEETVLTLAEYVLREQSSLFELSTDAVMEGRVQWGRPPAWKRHTSSKASPSVEAGDKTKPSREEESSEDAMETGDEWREATAPDGRTYYWNIRTRETRWEKPAEKTPA